MINLKVIELVKKQMQENYILNGGGTMYNYSVSDNVTNEVLSMNKENNNKKKVNELLDIIKKTNSKFSKSGDVELPVSEINLQRKTFENKTDDEIMDIANSELQEYKNSQVSNLTKENELKEKQLNSNIETLTKDKDETLNEVSNYYDQVKQNASDDALKRGLARSSIVVNQLNAFDEKELGDYMKLNDEYGSKIQALNFELNGLEGQLDQALSDFDVAYAVKLQDKINSIKTNLNKQESEVIEYNNQIALKESQFNKDLAKLSADLEKDDWNANIDLVELYGKYGSNVINKYLQDNVLSEAGNFLNGLSQNEALEILQNQEIKKLLGSNYNALLKKYSG